MIAIIDTGGANLSSVSNALDRLDRDWVITTDHEQIRSASHVILPGVGAAKDSMQRIRQANLVELIRSLKQPTIGICLGMQLLYEYSEEGQTECLGIIPGEVSHIPKQSGLSLPHMGWNQLVPRGGGSILLKDVPAEQNWFYFVHSYRGAVNEYTKATTNYGCEVTAIVEKDNFYGTQFHPEKSASAGEQILRNFLAL